MNHDKWNNRDRDTPENIVCSIANDGMWFWALKELDRDTTGIPIEDLRAKYMERLDPYVQLVRECQVTCILEMRRAGLTNAKIAEALHMDATLVGRRIKQHMEAKR